MTIRPVRREDYAACLSIYNYYVQKATATFETVPLTPAVFFSRIDSISSRYPWLVCEIGGRVAGYAYLDEFSPRQAYRSTCDLSVYVDADLRGTGAGTALCRELESLAREAGLRTIVSIVTSENRDSLRFHEKLGFQRMAELPDVAEKFGRSLGIVYLLKRL